MKQIILLFCFVAVTFGKVVDHSNNGLPKEIKYVCNRNHPQRDICFKDAIQRAIPDLKEGVESLQIPSIDPLAIDNARFEYTVPSALLGSLTLKNTKCVGLSRTQVKNVRSEFTGDGMSMEIDVAIPRIFFEGYYKGLNRFSDFRHTSKGFFNMTVKGIETSWKMSGKVEDRNGEKYMKINKFDMAPEVKSIRNYFEGLFPDPELNNVVVALVNQFSIVIYREMLPETKRYWEPILIDVVNTVMDKIPFRTLFPTDG